MSRPDPYPRQLPSRWRSAVEAGQGPAPTPAVGLDAGRKVDRGESGAPIPYGHSPELRALIARLHRERLRRGVSLGDVARLTGQARSAISRLENGHYPNPTFDTVYRYAAALGLHIALSAEPLRDEVDVVVPEVPDPE